MPPVRVVHAVTSPLTLILMRGQLGYLRQAGFQVTVVSAPGEELERIRAAGQADVVAVSMVREIAPFSDLRALIQLYRRLRVIQPAIVNAGTPKAGLLVGLAAWLAGVPCRVQTLRGLRSETAPGWKAAILRATERISCRVAHRVICNSPSLRERAIELGITDTRHSLVLGSGSSNGVDASRFCPTDDLLRRAAGIRSELAIPAGAPVIGFVGRLTRDKGIPELIAAFDLLRTPFPNLYLLLIGDREAGDPLPAAIHQRLDRDPQILCTGAVPDAAPYYPLMTVYALPTHREGFPNSVLEAQAAGLPVVTTRATGAVDSIVDGITGILVPPGDGSALAKAIESLLSDPALAQRMGAAGRERVARDFRPETIWEALAALYRGLLRERGLSAATDAAVSTQ
jgi:glycosyltransferase involved in cell wall biosynthesis